MSIFSICADPFSSGVHRSHGRNNSNMMETTMKVVGTAGAFFFTLGAMVLDPLLIVPAVICAAVALISFTDCDLSSITLTDCVPSAPSGRPRHQYTHVPAATPVYTGSYSTPVSSYSARAIPSYPVYQQPQVPLQSTSSSYSVAPPPPVTTHTARGGGYIPTVPAASLYAPPPPPPMYPAPPPNLFAPSSPMSWGDPSPPVSYNQQQQTARSVAPPPVVHVGRGGNTVATSRMQQPAPPPSSTTVAPPPPLHVRRGGGSNEYVVTGNNT